MLTLNVAISDASQLLKDDASTRLPCASIIRAQLVKRWINSGIPEHVVSPIICTGVIDPMHNISGLHHSAQCLNVSYLQSLMFV